MKKILLLCLFLQGCATLPVYIPTGNPITDVIVTAAVEEGVRYAVANQIAPALFGPVPRMTDYHDYGGVLPRGESLHFVE